MRAGKAEHNKVLATDLKGSVKVNKGKAKGKAQRSAKKANAKTYTSKATAKQASASKASFALPRQVIDLKTGEVFENPRQIWVKGDLTKAQKNKLWKELYTAAKQGEYPVIEMGGVHYQLFAGYVAAQG